YLRKISFKFNYCYEDLTHPNKFMQAATIDNLCKFVEAKLVSGVKDEIRVKWFGGEPLLAKEIIVDLSLRLQNLAAQYHVNYNAVLVTNGYLLDQLSAQDISQLELKTIQITLDGPERVHNIRRPRQNWDGSYAQIVANITTLMQFYSDLVIRINIDKNNAPYIHELFLDLEQRGLLTKCKHFQFAYVDTQIGRYTKAAVCAEANNASEIVRSYAIITANLVKHGFAKYAPVSYPRVIPAACDAQINNHYVINPEGYIFKCLGDVTMPERAFYHLNSAKVINTKRECELQALNLCMHKLCSECAMLPICHSGCRAKYLDLNATGPFCRSHCHTLRQQLIAMARSKLQ
ncbi:MAG: SPASM domain-containing protein, partial [Gammaproteobacteria bacterium]|nr:SPASM domain-containing protein [Gammaproteobacteria bacterium]